MHKHTNRLAHENSPYLLQHAHNPVDWYPWGDEAFEKAKLLDKPVLVSIGYSACHWCHVMERESFENEQTAEYMNRHFVNVKVDREERPDVDHIYMDAVQAMTGSGGWPLNVFLLPDGRPFFGGTYFPPARAFNRSSWLETLQAVVNAFNDRRDELESQATNLTEHIRNSNITAPAAADGDALDPESLDIICDRLLKTADTQWGGFGRAPKFPQTFSIQFLLRHFHFTSNQAALQQALLSLNKMIYGGIYDHLGGGFARYSTDEQWLAPHFEKMLYDNALLVSAMAEAFQLTKNELYKQTIAETLAFIHRELQSSEGGFYSALDADSEGEEGKFYTWDKSEIDEVLGKDSELFCKFYNVSAQGNWEHTNILWITVPASDFLNDEAIIDQDEFEVFLQNCRQKLLVVRDRRVRPGLDDKILLSWNALMIVAFCKAFAALSIEEYRQSAVRGIEFLEKNLFDGKSGEWRHTYKNGDARHPAFLEDLAYLCYAYIHLQEVTGNAEYLWKAKELIAKTITDFKAVDEPFFYFTAKDQADVIVRKIDVYDGATPAGNSVMAYNLLYLGKIFNEPEWMQQAVKMLESIVPMLLKYPTSFGNWASALQYAVMPISEIAVTGSKANEAIEELMQVFMPAKVVQWAQNPQHNMPLLSGKEVGEETKFFFCWQYACQRPVYSVKELLAQVNMTAV